MLSMMLTWFTVPTASDMIASSSAYSTDIFSSLTLILGIAIGIPIGVLAIKWIIALVRRNVAGVFKGRRGGRRRRR